MFLSDANAPSQASLCLIGELKKMVAANENKKPSSAPVIVHQKEQ